MNRLEEIKQRRSLITNQGNWFVMHGEDLMGNCGYDEPDSLGWVRGGTTESGQNAEFAANSPADIDWLIEEVKRYKRALEHVQFNSEHAQFLSMDGANNFREFVFKLAKEALNPHESA